MRNFFWVIACVCLLVFGPLAAPKALATITADHLVISQVQITGGPGLTTNDFVEIHNPTSADIDLNGMRLVKRTETGQTDTLIKSWTETAIVPAGGYYLWANSNFTGIAAVPDTSTTQSIADNNGVALRMGPNDTGEIIDSVAWGSAANIFVEGSNFVTNPGANESILRSQDTDDNSIDFAISSSNPRNSSFTPALVPEEQEPEPEETNPAPSPTPPPPSGGSGPSYSSSVIISEFMPNPSGADSGSEWIELYSPTQADLSGWKLADASSGSPVPSSAYALPAGTKINAGEYLAINIPSGRFALNNSGGDSVRLFWPDNTLVQTVSYEGTALENWTYARQVSGNFAWTSIATAGFANQFSQIISDDEDDNEFVPNAPAIDYIKINEILPNPKGKDAGFEWIEITNIGTQYANLAGWMLDDGSLYDPIISKKYVIDSGTIAPGEFKQIIIPAGKFAMNNTGTETIRLFDPTNTLIDHVIYEGAKEGLSYSLFEGEWDWVLPTPGELNLALEEIFYSDEIVISEVLPYPKAGVDEYIKIKNNSDIEVNLKEWTLADNARSFVLPDTILVAGGTVTIHKAQSMIALNNYGSEVVYLRNPLDEVVDMVEFDDPPRGGVYARRGDDFVWVGGVAPKQTPKVFVTLAEEELAEEEFAFVDENFSQQEFSGEVAGVALAQSDNQIPLPPAQTQTKIPLQWLGLGFVIGMIFCYILVKSSLSPAKREKENA